MIDFCALKSIVQSDFKLEEIENYTEEKLRCFFGNDFANMKDYNQNNPHHCYNLLKHTVCTALSISKAGLSDTDFVNLRIAALFHDIGKPAAAFDKDNRTVFYNHAVKSAEFAEKLLKKIGLSDVQSNYICFLIRYHDVFISFKLKEEIFDLANPYIKEINAENIERQIRIIQEKSKENGDYVPNYKDFNILMNLCFADALAQSDIVIQNGIEIDSKMNKIKRLNLIRNLIRDKI